MAPKSHSAKPASGSKPKSTSSTSAVKIKQELLKGRKPAVSLGVKANHSKGRKPAVPSSAKENHDARMKQLEAENDALRKTLAVKERATAMIPRPEKGVAGNGFNLQEAMGLADDAVTYAVLRRAVRDLAAKAGLDCTVLWHRQPKDLISKIIGAARERHSYLKRFPHGWPVEEFLKSNLKNKRAYARKRGYLGDQTNQGEDGGDGSEGSDGDDRNYGFSNHGSDDEIDGELGGNDDEIGSDDGAGGMSGVDDNDNNSSENGYGDDNEE